MITLIARSKGHILCDGDNHEIYGYAELKIDHDGKPSPRTLYSIEASIPNKWGDRYTLARKITIQYEKRQILPEDALKRIHIRSKEEFYDIIRTEEKPGSLRLRVLEAIEPHIEDVKTRITEYILQVTGLFSDLRISRVIVTKRFESGKLQISPALEIRSSELLYVLVSRIKEIEVDTEDLYDDIVSIVKKAYNVRYSRAKAEKLLEEACNGFPFPLTRKTFDEKLKRGLPVTVSTYYEARVATLEFPF